MLGRRNGPLEHLRQHRQRGRTRGVQEATRDPHRQTHERGHRREQSRGRDQRLGERGVRLAAGPVAVKQRSNEPRQ